MDKAIFKTKTKLEDKFQDLPHNYSNKHRSCA